MITKEIAYKKAFENQKARLKKKEFEYDSLLKSAYMSNTRLKEIDTEMSAIGAEITYTALKGDTKKLSELKKKSEALTAEKDEILKKSQVKEIKFECDICKDTGYVSGKICECIKREAAQIMADELSKQMPLDESRFEDFDLNYYKDDAKRRMTAILKLCREYVINFSPNKSDNLLFIGKTGLGKTHLSLAVVSGVIEKGYLPIYGSAENLFSSIENEKFSGEGKGTYDSILNCDLLVIDDLGTEMVTAFTKSALYNIVNTRLLSRKPTVINTNLSMREIQNLYGERIASRFMGNYVAREFLGNDIRQQKLLNK